MNEIFKKRIELNRKKQQNILHSLFSFSDFPFVAFYDYTFSNKVLEENKNLSVDEILEKSKELIKGKRKDLFLLQVKCFGWIIPVAVFCFLFFVFPTVKLLFANNDSTGLSTVIGFFGSMITVPCFSILLIGMFVFAVKAFYLPEKNKLYQELKNDQQKEKTFP